MAEISTGGDQPGQYVAPTGGSEANQPAPVVMPPMTAATQPPIASQPSTTPLDAGTAFKPDDSVTYNGVPTGLSAQVSSADAMGTQPEPVDPTDDPTIAWTASEFIAHAKSFSWYGRLALATIALAVVVYFVTFRDVISTGVVIICGFLFGVAANRQPREQQFRLDGRGVQVGGKQYSYDTFRSFSVVPEGAFSSIVFMPLKRFAILTTIYYAPEDEKRIVDLLTNYLPYEEYQHDLLDRLLLRIRF